MHSKAFCACTRRAVRLWRAGAVGRRGRAWPGRRGPASAERKRTSRAELRRDNRLIRPSALRLPETVSGEPHYDPISVRGTGLSPNGVRSAWPTRPGRAAGPGRRNRLPYDPGMRYRTLGDSGLLVSVVGLGCNNFGGRLDVARTRAVVDAAIDEGITLLDTADILRRAGRLRARARRGAQGPPGQGRARHQVRPRRGHGVRPGGRRQGRPQATSRSPWRSPSPACKTDYIDLYQLHTPDPVTPIDETIAALDDLVTEGKVRYIGHSNLSGWQIADAAHTALARRPYPVHLRAESLVAP